MTKGTRKVRAHYRQTSRGKKLVRSHMRKSLKEEVKKNLKTKQKRNTYDYTKAGYSKTGKIRAAIQSAGMPKGIGRYSSHYPVGIKTPFDKHGNKIK